MALLSCTSKINSAVKSVPSRSCPHVVGPACTESSKRTLLDFAPSGPARSLLRKVVSRVTVSASSSPAVPVVPSVKIDNIHDPFATLVTVDMGEGIGEIVETVGW